MSPITRMLSMAERYDYCALDEDVSSVTKIALEALTVLAIGLSLALFIGAVSFKTVLGGWVVFTWAAGLYVIQSKERQRHERVGAAIEQAQLEAATQISDLTTRFDQLLRENQRLIRQSATYQQYPSEVYGAQ